ncbi:MAG TPA: PAS domain S-box protein [Anaeromyxobacter sp.]
MTAPAVAQPARPRDAPAAPAAPSPTTPLVLFLVLAVAAAVAGVLSYGATAADLRRQKQRELESIAALKVEELERWRDERLSDAEFIAAGLLPADAVVASARGAAGARLVAWFHRLREAGDYSGIALATADGGIGASSGIPAQPPDPDLEAAIRAAVQGRRIVVTGVHRIGITGALHLDVVAPGAASDGAAGAVILRIDPYRYLFRFLQSWPGPSATGEALLVWRDGERVRFANELRYWDDDPLALSVPLGRREDPAALAAAGEVGVAEGIDYRGRRVLAAMRQVPDTPWALVVKVDADEAAAPLRGRAVWIAIAALALVAAAGAGSTLWWRQQRARFDRQRIRTEVERAALLEKMEWITRYGNDMVFLTDGDAVVETNDRAAVALGYAPGELVGLPVRELRDPATLGDLEDRVREQREAGFARYDTRLRRKDGTTFPVELTVRLMDIGGSPHHQAVARDITERRSAEEALRASEEKFRAAFEQAGLGIALVDRDGRLLDTNRALRRILGAEEVDPRGRAIAELVSPEGDAAAPDAVGALLDGRRASVEGPLRLRRPDGASVETIVRARPVHGPAGEIQYALAVVEDVSDRKRMEAQLLLADRMASVGTLAAGVAHEINNPLSYIVANVDYAIEELGRAGAPPDVLSALAEAKQGGARVREIVRDLKTFSRPHGGDRAPVDVREVLRSAVSVASNEIRHRARLELDLAEVPRVLGSERRLGQVFLNLLVNAAQAIPEGHAEANVIRATTRTAAGGGAEVEISDSGCGIDAAILDRIFDPFFTTKPVGIGTGLGLAICHGIVTGLGGEIHVRSATGRGTTVVVRLPAARPEAAERPAPSAPALARGRAGRILVVDDEPLVARAVARVLAPPHEVVIETGARAALARIEGGDRRFDAVMCDLMMPEMTGMELHARLATTDPELAARMVFLTGGAFTASAREFLDRVANPRLEKPIGADVLRALVGGLLGTA